MTDEQDDLTLVYAYGYKRGQESMKAEIDRLRDDNIALRELRAELILRALDESAAEIKRLRAALDFYRCGCAEGTCVVTKPKFKGIKCGHTARVALAGEKNDD